MTAADPRADSGDGRSRGWPPEQGQAERAAVWPTRDATDPPAGRHATTDDRVAVGDVKRTTATAGHGGHPITADDMERVRALVRSWGYFALGCDRDDMEGEAMVGLVEAAAGYRPELGEFWPFARVCIARQLYTLIRRQRTANRQAFHFSRRVFVNEDGDTIDAGEWIPDRRADPYAIAADRETLVEIGRAADTMTPIERVSLFARASGMSYAEIGDAKRVDNALGRARAKLRRALAA